MLSNARYRRQLIFLSIVLPSGLLLYCQQGKNNTSYEFTVQRLYSPRPSNEKVQILIEWSEIEKRFGNDVSKGFILDDLNATQQIETQLIDHDQDKEPEQVLIEYTFASNEPVFAFTISRSDTAPLYSNTQAEIDSRLKITWLTSYAEFTKSNPVTSWSDKIIQSTMQVYPDPAQMAMYAPERWNYEYGFFLNAVFVRWQETKNEAYHSYITRWVDRFIDENGKLDSLQYKPLEYKLDDILPGRLFLSLYEVTKEEKYKNAANQLTAHLMKQPKTSDGGYWHKQIYPSQMWLDGIYMGDLFSLQYAHTFDSAQWIDEAIHQMELIAKHTTDSTTGLMYHGWDESKNKVWAHPAKGTSPEFWGRAIGWYIMALADGLDYIPADHPKREVVVKLFQQLAASVLKYQDSKSKLWFQVMDKGSVPGNWIETSCSAMFTYAFAKGHRLGYLDASYHEAAQASYNSLLQDYVAFDDVGVLYLNRTVKIGTLNPKNSKGDFDYYVTTECRINDYKGLAALLYASLELDRSLAKN